MCVAFFDIHVHWTYSKVNRSCHVIVSGIRTRYVYISLIVTYETGHLTLAGSLQFAFHPLSKQYITVHIGFGYEWQTEDASLCKKKPVTTMLTYPWKCTVLHCNHLGNTWKPLVLMTRHFDYCPSASEC